MGRLLGDSAGGANSSSTAGAGSSADTIAALAGSSVASTGADTGVAPTGDSSFLALVALTLVLGDSACPELIEWAARIAWAGS